MIISSLKDTSTNQNSILTTGNGVFVRNLKEFLNKYQWLKSFRATEYVYSSSSLHKDNVTFSNDLTEIHKRKIENFKNTIIGHLNINSLRNKFVFAQDLIRDFDIFLILESKLDDTFPNNQFKIDHYKMFRLDRNRYGGGLVLYVNEQVPCKKLTNYENPIASEIILLEFHQSKRKWLILGIYKAPNQKDAEFLQHLSWLLDFYNTTHENIIIIGDFNMTTENQYFNDFMEMFTLSCLINKPTCFQSINPTCIDLILTNKPNLFKLSANFETGLSDHHKLISTIMKSGSFKRPPKKKVYRSYKNFSIDTFNDTLKINLENIKDNNTYDVFEKIFLEILDKQAPLKTKMLRHNNKSFMSKELRKNIML